MCDGPGYIQGAITPFLALEYTYDTVGTQVILKRILRRRDRKSVV